MPRGKHLEWDDAWIEARWDSVRNWLTLCREYNETHGTDRKYNTFKAHCNRELGLNYHYTEEQKGWLKENFPHLGRCKTSVEFEKKFGQYRSPQAIKIYCNKVLGLRVTRERKAEIAVENTGRHHPVGTVMIVGNNGLCEKTECGWERIADRVVGKAPSGYRIVHLDGDITNNRIENLKHLSFAHCALMTRYNFWSSNPEITETAIKWCDLHETVRSKENG